MKRKIIAMLLVIFLVPNFVHAKVIEPYINNNGIEISDNDYINLLNLGFTEFEIENMNLDEFNSNHNLIGNIVSSETKYYKNVTRYDNNNNLISNNDYEITLTDYISGEQTNINLPYGNGYVETNYKKMTTQIISVVNKYRYKVTVQWKSIPSVRSYDIIGIGINSNVVIDSGITFQQDYCYSNGTCYSSNVSMVKTLSSGGGALFCLPSSSNVSSMSSYLYFNVNKKNTGSIITSQHAYGDYAHAVKTTYTSYYDHFSVTQAGIVLDSTSVNSYDTMSSAIASWSGNW